MDLLTAKGEAIGAAALIPEGWAMGRITYRDPSAGEATSFKQNTFAPSVDPGLLTVPALFDGADWVTFGQAGESGIGNATTRVHADVQRHVAETLGINQQRLVRATTENGAFVQTQVSDAAGNLTAFWNEAGTAWGYVYDALGRLREVQLPDGKAHRVSFDGHGRVSRVERQGIATIDYGYEPVTGLLAEKRFTGNTGVLRRRITTSHDAIGRVSVETHEDVSTGETRSFSFSYDGGSQLGQLTGVTGQDFQKELSYRADAKLESRVLTLAGGWRKLRTSFTYNEAGEPASQSTTVEDATGTVLVSSSTSDSFDPYGRLASSELPGSTLASFGYDPDGLLENALLAGGNSLGLTYDGLTHALTGTAQLSGTMVASVTRRYNARALVEWDSISVGALTVDRSYDYFDERFLKSSTDARAESRYTYSPSGLPTSITENDAPVQVTTQSDDLGRTTLRDDLVMTYGPDGQLAWATRGGAVWTFSYDEAGQRLLKYTNGVPVAAYPEEGYLDASGLVQPVKVAGRTVGLLVNGTFEPRSTDLLGSPIADLNGAPRIASPYGSRLLDGHPARTAALDYVEKGFDADLGLVRMGVRDYDPERALFVSPDPLYLESPNLCVESALDCMLYAYARSNPLLYVDPEGREPSLSPTNYALYVPEGYAIRAYNTAAREMANPDNPAWQRGVMGLGAFATAPLGLAEEVLRGIFNVPFTVHNAGISMGERSARAVQRVQSGDYQGAVLESLYVVRDGSTGFVAAGTVAVPVAGAVEGAVARSTLARTAASSAGGGAPRLLSQFTKSTIDDVVGSAGRLTPGG